MEINKRCVILLTTKEEVIQNFKDTLSNKFNVYYVKSPEEVFTTFEETTKSFSFFARRISER